ncbi:Signal peptidase complex catalytic subunit [Entomophthora muscae]|uniref:Signal peptidase complex catalytic subunit n=2 Tax=Entomophthora muscae TaxID=34485 RepID=A0ACC2RK02_9FUNG|nr:Signal peptidase complex catalytic subunit [Entomophthora muscae]
MVSSAFMSWKALAYVTNTESPAVVVLSGSMEPAFYRGDLLFLTLGSSPIEIGEVVVFKLPGRDIPIVHRVLKIHVKNETNEEFILTKGDNNNDNDRLLYDRKQLWLERHHIVGRVNGHLPYLGMITIILNDYPKLKAALLGIMALIALSSNEEQ